MSCVLKEHTIKFIKDVTRLKEEGVIESNRDVADMINYRLSNLITVLKGDRNIPKDKALLFRSAIENGSFQEDNKLVAQINALMLQNQLMQRTILASLEELSMKQKILEARVLALYDWESLKAQDVSVLEQINSFYASNLRQLAERDKRIVYDVYRKNMDSLEVV